MFRAVVNWAEEHFISSPEDAEKFCVDIARLPTFAVHVTGPGGDEGPTLDVIVESDRAIVDLLDMKQGVKLGSRNPACGERDIVSLRNDAFPELQLDQIEVERRDLISAKQAIAILRRFLTTGEVVDLVAWPPED
jgi:hypothetical protein